MKEYIKPNALWLSCNDDWLKFATHILNRTYKYEYIFTIDETKIITINSYKDLYEFNNKYKSKSTLYINWKKVSKDYSGIYITNPRFKEAISGFLGTYFWYSGFDICSVAIWNKDAIKSISEPKIRF